MLACFVYKFFFFITFGYIQCIIFSYTHTCWTKKSLKICLILIVQIFVLLALCECNILYEEIGIFLFGVICVKKILCFML